MTKFDFSELPFAESLSYSLDEEISSTFARLRAGGDMAGSLHKVLNALLDRRIKDAESQFEQARRYLDFVHAETAKVRGYFRNNIPTTYKGLPLGTSLSPGDIAANDALLDYKASYSTPIYALNHQSGLLPRFYLPYHERNAWGDAPEMEVLEHRQHDTFNTITAIEEPRSIAYQQLQGGTERRWEEPEEERIPDLLWNDNRRYISDQFQMFGEEREFQQDTDHEVLWEAALVIAEEERQVHEEQDALLEQWHRERLKKYQHETEDDVLDELEASFTGETIHQYATRTTHSLEKSGDGDQFRSELSNLGVLSVKEKCEKYMGEYIDLDQEDQAESHAGSLTGNASQCTQCNQTFTSRRKLKAHNTIHSQAHTRATKQFKCRYCSKSFTRAANQSRHERSLHSSGFLQKWEM